MDDWSQNRQGLTITALSGEYEIVSFMNLNCVYCIGKLVLQSLFQYENDFIVRMWTKHRMPVIWTTSLTCVVQKKEKSRIKKSATPTISIMESAPPEWMPAFLNWRRSIVETWKEEEEEEGEEEESLRRVFTIIF